MKKSSGASGVPTSRAETLNKYDKPMTVTNVTKERGETRTSLSKTSEKETDVEPWIE